MFKKKTAVLLAAIMSFSAFGITSYAESGRSLDELYNNTIINGTFENDLSGWTAEGDAKIKRVTDVADEESAASAYIENGKENYAETKVLLRKNRYYHVTAKVKLKSGTGSAKIVIELPDGTLINAVGETKVSDEWTYLEGDFVKKGGSLAGEDKVPVNDEDLYVNAKCYVDTGSTDGFYLDNLIIEEYEGNINPNFQANDYLFGWEGNPAYYRSVALERDEQVNELIEKGLFPNVENVLEHVQGDCVTPSMIVPIDRGGEYVVSAWFKLLDHEGGESAPCGQVLVAGIPVFPRENTDHAGINMVHLRRVNPGFDADKNRIPTKQGAGWQYIEATISMPETATIAGFDMKINLAFYNLEVGNAYVQSGCGEGLKFQLAELKVEPKNAFGTFATSATTGARNDSSIQPLTGYTLQGAENGRMIFNENTYGVESYNNCLQLGAFDLTGNASIAKSNIAVKGGRKYDIGVWVMPSADTVGDISVKMQSKIGSGRPKTVVSETPIEKGKWTKITADAVEISKSDASNATITLSFSGGESGTVYFGGFDMVEKKISCVPVMESVELSELTFGKDGKAVVSAKCDNSFAYRYFYLYADSEDSSSWKVAKSGFTKTGEAVPDIFPEVYLTGKYVKLKVIPVDETLTEGEALESNTVFVKDAIIVGDVKEISPEEGRKSVAVSVKNTSDDSKAVAVVAAFYNANSEMTAIGVDNRILAKDEEAEFSVTVEIAEYEDVRVFILEGSDEPETKPLGLNPISAEK